MHTTTLPTGEHPPLTNADRCDAECRAQAFTRAVMPGGGVLLFCGHHFAKHEHELRKQALELHDFRDQINAKSQSSA